tara:strand:- start:1944 stop:2384 length:441 start_codon:yes stop_codon:yes gene_type:complete
LSLLSKAQILQMIPHQGKMNLLDQVEFFDEHSLVASTCCHQDCCHPLAYNGIWPTHTVVEMAAQGMALHGVLTKSSSGDSVPPRQAFIGAVSRLSIAMPNLAHSLGPLSLHVTRESYEEQSATYHFRGVAGDNLCAEGDALVVFGA